MDDDYWKTMLCKAGDYFRNKTFLVSRPVTSDEGRAALQIASLFKEEFSWPVMVALLSLSGVEIQMMHTFTKLLADWVGT